MILTISDLQDQITKSNDMKNLNKLEDKLIVRQNDCVKALTKKLADRDEITKKLRIANNSIKNIYELVKFIFIEGDEEMKELKK
jgi:organic radical activating enzyme